MRSLLICVLFNLSSFTLSQELLGLNIGKRSSYRDPTEEIDLQAKQFYEKIIKEKDLSASALNDDGVITLSNMKVKGRLVELTSKNIDYLCKAFLGNEAAELKLEKPTHKSIMLSPDYEFDLIEYTQLVTHREGEQKVLYALEKSSHTGVRVLTRIDCHFPEKATPVSKRYKRKEMLNNGKINIYNPTFLWHGKEYDFSAFGNVKGICKLYGYLHYYTSITAKRSLLSMRRHKTVNVDHNGRYLRKDERNYGYISKITCSYKPLNLGYY